jgi:hypothetical protein
MVQIWLHPAPEESRTVELADGRVIFFPGGRDGRAYHVRSHHDALAMERRLEWVRHAANGAALATIGAVVWSKDPRFLLFVLPALAAPFLAQRVVVWGLPEVTDPLVLREVGSTAGTAFPWGSTVILALFAAGVYYFGFRFNAHTLFQAGVGGLALLAIILQWLRRERLRREREFFRVSDTPENRPIVPR